LKRTASFNLWPALTSLLLFAGLCAITAYWALQLLVPKPAVAPTETSADQRGSADSQAVLELFGQPAMAGALPAAVVSNIQVVGITAGDAKGSAILAIDGAPGRFYAIGSKLSEGVTLVAVKSRSVVIERGGARSELPAPPVANLSVLTSGVGKSRQAVASPANPPPFGAAAVNVVMPQNTPPLQPGQVAPVYAPSPSGVTSPGAINQPGTIPNPGAISNQAPGVPANPPGAMAPPPPPGFKSP
jgi:general secretion pathway protein C